jgi:hypothetical protein
MSKVGRLLRRDELKGRTNDEMDSENKGIKYDGNKKGKRRNVSRNTGRNNATKKVLFLYS